MRANCINPTCHRRAAPYSLRCEEHKRLHTAMVLFAPRWTLAGLLAWLLPFMALTRLKKPSVFRIVNRARGGR